MYVHIYNKWKNNKKNVTGSISNSVKRIHLKVHEYMYIFLLTNLILLMYYIEPLYIHYTRLENFINKNTFLMKALFQMKLTLRHMSRCTYTWISASSLFLRITRGFLYSLFVLWLKGFQRRKNWSGKVIRNFFPSAIHKLFSLLRESFHPVFADARVCLTRLKKI